MNVQRESRAKCDTQIDNFDIDLERIICDAGPPPPLLLLMLRSRHIRRL